jgi:SAM-dependent methyltransferase
MRLASQSDFYNGPIYTQYRHHEGYAKRARLFRYFPEPVLVVGCGFGFMVQEFLDLGLQAWGIDVSPYAVENRVTPRVVYGNILDLSECQLGEFATLFTEDLLPCLNNDEVLICARNCQALSPIVIHLVTVQGEALQLNYHSTAEWMNLTSQPTVSLEGM